jgi:hypothetical protein
LSFPSADRGCSWMAPCHGARAYASAPPQIRPLRNSKSGATRGANLGPAPGCQNERAPYRGSLTLTHTSRPTRTERPYKTSGQLFAMHNKVIHVPQRSTELFSILVSAPQAQSGSIAVPDRRLCGGLLDGRRWRKYPTPRKIASEAEERPEWIWRADSS